MERVVGVYSDLGIGAHFARGSIQSFIQITMSKTALYIHFTNDEWLGFEGPEEPQVSSDDSNFLSDAFNKITKKVISEQHQNAIVEAAKNSLKILNPEVMKGMSYLELKGKYYQWPGTYEINGYCIKCAEAEMCVNETMCSAIKMIELTPPRCIGRGKP
jgi:hypothetical protein